METIHQSDLDRGIKLNEIEAFTAEQLKQYAEESMNEIQKSEGSKDELMKSVADEIRSFTPYKVIGQDHEGHITEKIMMVRRAQIEWDEPAGDDISKARSGTYLNTPENVKLGRAGRKYGEKKESDKDFIKRENEKTKNAPDIIHHKDGSKTEVHSMKEAEEVLNKKEGAKESRDKAATNRVDKNSTIRQVRQALYQVDNQEAKIKVYSVNGNYETTVHDERHDLFKESGQDDLAGIKKIEFID